MVGIADGFSPVAIAPCPSVAGAPSACPSAPCGRLCEEVSRSAEDPAIRVLSSVPDAPHRAGGLQSQSTGGRLTASRAGTGAICVKGVARIYMWIGSTRATWHQPANKMVNAADQFCRSALCQRLIGGRSCVVNLAKQIYSGHLPALGKPTSSWSRISLTASVVGVFSTNKGRQPGGHARPGGRLGVDLVGRNDFRNHYPWCAVLPHLDLCQTSYPKVYH